MSDDVISLKTIESDGVYLNYDGDKSRALVASASNYRCAKFAGRAIRRPTTHAGTRHTTGNAFDRG